MSNVRLIKYNEKYNFIEPLNKFSESFGYCMVVNHKGEVLKFFESSYEGRRNGIKYFDYISLSLWEKLNYWLHYKRGR